MRNDKGAISVFTLLAMLFFLIFVMVIYRNIAAKSKTQVETTEVLLDIYDSDTDSSVVYEKSIYDLTNDEDDEIVSTENSYIGYYADVDGDGEVDGIIFADLAVAESGTWDGGTEESSYSYSWSAVTSGLKEYELTGERYEDEYFGTRYVIAPVDGTSGTDRFYVMDLEDTTTSSSSTFYWYYNAYRNLDGSLAPMDFGSGLSNTTSFLIYWANSIYGSQNSKDMWGISAIGSNVGDSNSIWFVPSYYEWVAFGGVFGITDSNYLETYGLNSFYWTSSILSTGIETSIRFVYRNHARKSVSIESVLCSPCYNFLIL